MSDELSESLPAPKDIFVLDSSALIAFLDGEPSAPQVATILFNAKTTAEVYVHSVNMCEVIYHFGPQRQTQNQSAAQNAVATLKGLGVVERFDLDEEFRDDIAMLISERRAMPKDPNKPRHRATLALGDAFGIALARRLNGIFVTGDRSEIEPMQYTGFCRVHFIK